MKKTMIILMAVVLIALPTTAQQNWRNQQTVYGGQYRTQQNYTMSSATTYHPATYHSTTFHSTGSSMMRTGSMYSAKPVINSYGSAVYRGAPRRSSKSSRSSSGPHRGLINWGSGDDSGGGVSGDSGEGGYIGEGGWSSSGEGIGGGIVTPDQNDDDDRPNGTPLGDGVWPLLLFACAYLIVRVTRKRALKS